MAPTSTENCITEQVSLPGHPFCRCVPNTSDNTNSSIMIVIHIWCILRGRRLELDVFLHQHLPYLGETNVNVLLSA